MIIVFPVLGKEYHQLMFRSFSKFTVVFADGRKPPAMLDAPVSGGVLAAENGTLTFMVFLQSKWFLSDCFRDDFTPMCSFGDWLFDNHSLNEFFFFLVKKMKKFCCFLISLDAFNRFRS